MKNPRVLLLIDTSRNSGREMIAGIRKYSRLHGPWKFYTEIPFFAPATGSPFSINELDGLIVHVFNLAIISQIASMGVPAIVRGYKKPVPNVPNFISDNEAIGKMAAEHFLGLGLKNFGFYGYSGFTWSKKRGEYFSEWIKQSGFVAQLYSLPRPRSPKTLQKTMGSLSNWLKQLPKPAGV